MTQSGSIVYAAQAAGLFWKIGRPEAGPPQAPWKFR